MMKPNKHHLRYLALPIVGAGLLAALMGMSSETYTAKPAAVAATAKQAAASCPNRMGWEEGLVMYLKQATKK